MGNNNRGGFGGSGRSGGRAGGGFRGRSGGFDRERGEGSRGGGFDRARRPTEMYDVVCDKCGKECQVPFKPTGGRPVLCSDCFRQSGGGSRSSGFDRERGEGSRGGGFDRGRGDSSRGGSSSGISSEQLNKINAKLGKIIEILDSFEIETEDDDADESEEDSKEN